MADQNHSEQGYAIMLTVRLSVHSHCTSQECSHHVCRTHPFVLTLLAHFSYTQASTRHQPRSHGLCPMHCLPCTACCAAGGPAGTSRAQCHDTGHHILQHHRPVNVSWGLGAILVLVFAGWMLMLMRPDRSRQCMSSTCISTRI